MTIVKNITINMEEQVSFDIQIPFLCIYAAVRLMDHCSSIFNFEETAYSFL
jgi:hypothetical protein